MAANEIALLEQYALSQDRNEVVKHLIPDTLDYYVLKGLLYQSAFQEKDSKVDKKEGAEFFKKVREGHLNYATKVQDLLLRYDLLRFKDEKADEQKKILSTITSRLGLYFTHQKKVSIEEKPKTTYPTSLDEKLLTPEKLMADRIAVNNTYELSDLALQWLSEQPLTKNNLTAFLDRVREPCYPNLPKLILEDLKERKAQFGVHSIDTQLTVEQLQELGKLDETLYTNELFVTTLMKKLQPSEPIETLEAKAQKQYYQDACKFASGLSPIFNWIRALTYYHSLKYDQEQNAWDFSKFKTYLEFPWNSYPHTKHKTETTNFARLSTQIGHLRPPYSDESLIRDYLEQWFENDKNNKIDPWAPYLDNNWLKNILATVKLTRETKEEPRKEWVDLLGQSETSRLKGKVELIILPSNSKYYDAKDTVALDVIVKNIPKLVVKVFKINTRSYYRASQSEIDSTISLDGLTPHEETIQDYEKAGPFARIRRIITFQTLTNQKGVFVVELLGNGQRARAVIRKGNLTYLEHPTLRGHLFRLFDETGKLVQGTAWVQGRPYKSDDATGWITVPYTNSPDSNRPVIFTNQEGDLSTLGHFNHQSEQYSLTAGIYVDRESLLQKSETEVVIRASLFLNGFPVPLTAIVKATLKIDTVNADRVSSSQNIDDLKFTDNKDTVHTFNVPDELRTINLTLTVEVKGKINTEPQKLYASQSYEINTIDDTDSTEDLHLRFAKEGYSIYCLGKTGEPRPFRHVSLNLSHTYLRSNTINTTLQTDEHGRILLGHLPNISSVRANLINTRINQVWPITESFRSKHRTRIHGVEGEKIVIPYTGNRKNLNVAEFALLETRQGTNHSDVTKKYVNIKKTEKASFIVLDGVPKGEYNLIYKERLFDRNTEIRIGRGTKVMSEYVMDKDKFLQLGNLSSTKLTVVNVDFVDKNKVLEVKLAHHSESTRVHIFAHHFVPEYDVHSTFAKSSHPLPRVSYYARSANEYTAQRNLSDLQQYILDRKQAKKFVGNMLQRPSLLLVPRVRQDTSFDADVQERAGEAFMSVSASAKKDYRDRDLRERHLDFFARASLSSSSMLQTYQKSLEFLNLPSARLLNLIPDKGLVRVPVEKLGDNHTHISIVVVDGFADIQTVRVGLPTSTPPTVNEEKGELALDNAYRDIRLMPGLEEDKHYTEQHLISVLFKDQSKSIADIKTAVVETFESLSDVYTLFRTLSKGSQGEQLLDKFDFVLKWDELTQDAKDAKYSEFACHELNIFIYYKDRSFFERSIKPFLKDKLQKTFLDLWLLERDLKEFTTPLLFRRLNIFERILLAQRLKSTAIIKDICDSFSAIPHDPQRFIALFNTALQSRALDSRDKVSTIPKKSRSEAKEKAKEKEKLEERAGSSRKPKKKKKEMKRSMLKMEKRDEQDEEMEEAEEEREKDSYAEEEKAPRLFQAPPTTKEYQERNYYEFDSSRVEESANLIQINGFWRDFASYIGNTFSEDQKTLSEKDFLRKKDEEKKEGGFLSQHILSVPDNQSFPEMLISIAVLGLPFKSEKHIVDTDRATKFKFTAASNVILFHKEVKESEVVPSSVAVSQNYFDPSDPHEYVGDEKTDKYINDEFLPGRVYGCRVVITNVSSTHQKVEILQQIPAGAMPLGRDSNKAISTATIFKTVGPYATQVLEYFFYFPTIGRFNHYPVHVSKTNQVIGHGLSGKLKVVKKSSIEPVKNWNYISQEGTEAEVLEYLEKENLHRPDVHLEDIAFRCKDNKEFLTKALGVLRSRYVFNSTLWSYGLHHGLPEIISEYLPTTYFFNSIGPYFTSSLLSKDAFTHHLDAYQHLEYFPLINSRAHSLRNSLDSGEDRSGLPVVNIQNRQFRNQYQSFLNYLAYRYSSIDQFPASLLLSASYYMLLQDRIDDAVSLFAKTDKSQLKETKTTISATELELQYDYMAAYLDFFKEGGPTIAAKIAKKYKNYPVLRKRKLFQEIEQQLEESNPDATIDYKLGLERERAQSHIASTEPTLNLGINNGQIEIFYANLSSCVLNFYLMDIELLFSTNPFIQSEDSKFLSVAPNFSYNITLPSGKKSHLVEFPEKLKNSNVYVEVVAEGHGLTKLKTYYSQSLNVDLIEPLGQIKATAKTNGKPIARAYVKVYARMRDGKIDFYKDGYTDLRGAFDYASLSTDKMKSVQQFSILCLSEEFGAIVTEAGVPPQ